MIKPVSDQTALNELDAGEKKIYLTRPISLKKMLGILKKCGKLSEVIMGNDTHKRLSNKVKQALLDQGVFVKIEKNAGRPISVSLPKLFQAIELRNERKSLREIQKELGIPKSTLHYLLMYAQRTKIKTADGKIVFLEEKF